jgi:hypothetical protein
MTGTHPEKRPHLIGDARVSTYGQTLNVQTAQRRAEGRAKIYQERASDAQANRRELLKDLAPVT